jgi:hypothetical protein
MPAAVPLADYNTGVTSGMASGTTYSATLSSGAASPKSPTTAGGNANYAVAILVGIALAVLVAQHALGFRFAFDASVGRR